MMPEESSPVEIPFQELLDALVDGDTVLHPKYLYQLSDLEADKLKKLKEIWSLIPVWQRQSLMENLEQLSESDYVLSFEVLSRFAIHDRDPKVRFYAIRSLIEYEAKDMLLEFKHLLEYDSETEVRCIAATALGSFVYLGELEEIPADKKREIEDCLLRVTQGGEEPLVRRRAL